MTPTTEQLKDLLAKVTPGPWAKRGVNNMVCGPSGNTVADVRYKNGANDSRLIALAPTLAAEVVRLREALYAPKYEHLDAACYGMNCFPDELDFILEQYRQALNATSEK